MLDTKKKLSVSPFAQTLLIAALVVWVPLALAYLVLFRGGSTMSEQYQAVFLTNGQVYFGKLDSLHTAYPTLTDIYYLIVTRPLQSQQGGETQAVQPDFSLRKLGNELHGPTDRMVINKDHILFVEDLKETGKVVEAIRQTAASPEGQGGTDDTTQ